MLLATDIGNTNITLGLWHDSGWQELWRLATGSWQTVDECGLMLQALLRARQREGAVRAVVFCSVVPALAPVFEAAGNRYLGCPPLEVSLQLDLGITVGADNPAAVGADRLVNAVAAHALYPGPAIVVDLGTATKLDVVTGAGELTGGVIAPGLRLAADALVQRAAKLSHVPLTAPPRVLGRNTQEAMQSGLIYGYVSLVEGLVQRLRREHPDQSQPAQVVGTGGLLELIAPHTAVFDRLDTCLTLTGLRLVHQRAAGAGGANRRPGAAPGTSAT